MNDRHGKPLPFLFCLDPVSILPFIFFKLDIIQKHKGVASSDFIEIS